MPNKPYGTVTWSKTDTSGNLLAGSIWTLTEESGAKRTITDCASGTTCPAGDDQDPAAGKFTLTDVTWGDYTLEEAQAPAGYLLTSKKKTFSISATSFKDGIAVPVALGAIENEKILPTLPVTGGNSADSFFIAGGAAMALSLGAAGVLYRRKLAR